MSEVDRRSIRILSDLQACQTAASTGRGIGRYSSALFEAMQAAAGPRQLFGLLSAQHAVHPDIAGLPAGRLIMAPPLPDWDTGRSFRGGEQDSLDGTLLAAVAAAASPDVVHVSNLFEGFGERVAIPDPVGRPAGQVYAATLYDLIPLRFRDHYFANPDFAKWYQHRLASLHHADLLLAISECTRQDAIALLGLDPAKIVTIHGGVAEVFRPAADRDAARACLRRQYALPRPGIVLYTGGDDFRKNLAGALAGFAALPAAVRAGQQFVVICALSAERKAELRELAATFGLSGDDIVFPGFVPDEDLVDFYSACDVFVFPSLYEGLGLPVLEAMACGAPVLCADNSSLSEIAPGKHALFDAARPETMAARLQQAIELPAFAEELRSRGLQQARKFTWRATAARALEAFDEALARKRHAGVQAASSGWLPKPRLAMLTPLPPCRSGIADYNAKFLPYLAAHFDIDLYVDGYRVTDGRLNAAFRVFDAAEFRDRATSYDVIHYEFGNSEFHAYMLPLLEEFPGVVGLHDVYLSGLMGYADANRGDSGRLGSEMIASHAGQARRLLAPVQARPDPVGSAMVELPCTKGVLDHAIGIIGHSAFGLKVAQEFYPQGWMSPFRVVPQMYVCPAEPASCGDCENTDLNFSDDEFVIVAFGHITWTKLGDVLLEAFTASTLARDAKCLLVFAGETLSDEFGISLRTSIDESPLKARIRITGYLSDADFGRLLARTDIAVQLRRAPREGASRAALGCLAHGKPMIVNDVGSFSEFPNDVVVKIPPEAAAERLAAELEVLWSQPERRRQLGERSVRYIRERHNPEHCASQYAAAIHEFRARHLARQGAASARRLAPHLAALTDPAIEARKAADYLDSRQSVSFVRPRLVVDVSHIARFDHQTGIQRVVKEIVRSLYCSERSDFEAVAVERIGDQLFPALKWLERQGLLLPHEASDQDDPIRFQPGDRLLMLDSSWNEYAQFAPIFASARAAGVPITTAVYDLLPILLPPGNFIEGGREWFGNWLHQAIAASDNLVCISRSVADHLIRYIRANGLGRPGLQVGWWHLGSAPIAENERHRPVGRSPFGEPYVLMVGTIEPRKNHALAIDAFEALWNGGSEISLVIAGSAGWLVDDLLQRMRTHPEAGRRLFVVEQATDADIQQLYRHAAALLMISKGEGFGLPLVEAARHGVPTVCSDLPVFREVAAANAIYVRIDNADALAQDLGAALRRIEDGSAPSSLKLRPMSWDESAEALRETVCGTDWYWTQHAPGRHPRRQSKLRILYISVHETLEYDEFRMLSKEGHQVVCIGGRLSVLRDDGQFPDMKEWADEFHRSGCSLTERVLTRTYLQNFDVAIIMHEPDWFIRNREAFGDLPVIVRTVGQSTPAFEQAYRSLGDRIKIVRNSEREVGLEGFAKTDAVIYFGKYQSDFLPWRGGGAGLTFHNNYLQREQVSLPKVDLWTSFHEATGSTLWGAGNEQLAGTSGIAPYSQMKHLLAEAPWYFYVYSYPPSYTLSLMEAMFAGVPIIAPSRELAGRQYPGSGDLAWTPWRYEVPEIVADCGLLYDSLDGAKAAAARLLSDRKLATDLSANAKAKALKCFDADSIARQWTTFLVSVAG